MNEHKFDRKGAIYSKARPGYPDELFRRLTENGLISKNTVAADIGSGTGIFTEQLAAVVGTVFAVEPNDDMRLTAEKSYATLGNVISVSGSAESTSLPDKSVDFITVAQAFHWFDRNKFKAECRRILKDNGKILLVWNDRDASSKLIQENYEINRRFCPNFNGSSNGINFDKESFRNFFDGDIVVVSFRNDLIYDRDAFVARSLSSSYAPKPEEESYELYIDELKKLFDMQCNNSVVPYPYITRCYIGKV